MGDVSESTRIRGEKEGTEEGERTELKRVGVRIKHLRVHVGVEDPVLGGIVSSLNEDRVSLGDGNGESVGLERLGLDLDERAIRRKEAGKLVF
jgi:hypothetical protein